MKICVFVCMSLFLGSLYVLAMNGDIKAHCMQPIKEEWHEDMSLKLPAQTMFTAGQQILPGLSKNMHLVSHVYFNQANSFKAEGLTLNADNQPSGSFELIIKELPSSGSPNEVKFEAVYKFR